MVLMTDLLIKYSFVKSHGPGPQCHTGVEIVSQEDKSVVLAFADQAGRAEFESRLSTLARDDRATPSRSAFTHCKASITGRPMTARVRHSGSTVSPPGDHVYRGCRAVAARARRRARRGASRPSLAGMNESSVSSAWTIWKQPSLVMARLRCNRVGLKTCCCAHRDVRTVDPPPRTGNCGGRSVNDRHQFVACAASAPEGSPPALLDSGLTLQDPRCWASCWRCPRLFNPCIAMPMTWHPNGMAPLVGD